MTQQIREWTILEELGRGGMGVVYKATHEFMDGEYALKSIKPELAQDPEVAASLSERGAKCDQAQASQHR